MPASVQARVRSVTRQYVHTADRPADPPAEPLVFLCQHQTSIGVLGIVAIVPSHTIRRDAWPCRYRPELAVDLGTEHFIWLRRYRRRAPPRRIADRILRPWFLALKYVTCHDGTLSRSADWLYRWCHWRGTVHRSVNFIGMILACFRSHRIAGTGIGPGASNRHEAVRDPAGHSRCRVRKRGPRSPAAFRQSARAVRPDRPADANRDRWVINQRTSGRHEQHRPGYPPSGLPIPVFGRPHQQHLPSRRGRALVLAALHDPGRSVQLSDHRQCHLPELRQERITGTTHVCMPDGRPPPIPAGKYRAKLFGPVQAPPVPVRVIPGM
jgi:hypothetical protein